MLCVDGAKMHIFVYDARDVSVYTVDEDSEYTRLYTMADSIIHYNFICVSAILLSWQ